MHKHNAIAKILLIIFSCATAISVLSIYYTHQLPTSEIRTETIATYQHIGTYNYIAKLKPNIIYQNRTTLNPGEGTLYTAIIEYINLTFTYTFVCNPRPKDVKVEIYRTIQVESPGRWVRKLEKSEAEEMLHLSGSINWTMHVNPAKIKQFVEAIEKEIYGITRSATYNLKIKPEIHLTANLTTQTIEDTFTPELTVVFKKEAERGNYIAIEDLNHKKQNSITETEEIPLIQVQNQRIIAYIATVLTTAALIASALKYVTTKRAQPPAKIVKNFIKPYEELIAETQKPPDMKTTIEVKALEDLVKIAEILAKPVLHSIEGGEHIFYVIDDDIKYIAKLKLK